MTKYGYSQILAVEAYAMFLIFEISPVGDVNNET